MERLTEFIKKTENFHLICLAKIKLYSHQYNYIQDMTFFNLYSDWRKAFQNLKQNKESIYLLLDDSQFKRTKIVLNELEQKINVGLRTHDLTSFHPKLEIKFKKFLDWTNEIFVYFKSVGNDQPERIGEQIEIYDLELSTQNEQIRLLYDLGIIDHLKQTYPESFRHVNPLAKVIAIILKLNHTSISPSLSALINDNANKNYPKETPKTKALIDQLNANERF